MRKKARQSGGNPKCRMCVSETSESVSHIIEPCEALQLLRQKVLNDILVFCNENYIPIEIFIEKKD